MEIIVLEAGAEVILPSGAKQMYPLKWRGVVPDEIGQDWVDAGIAEDVTPEPVMIAVEFTPRQLEILRELADQIAAQQDAPIAFQAMRVGELRDLAALLDIEGSGKMKKADLVAILSEREPELRDVLAGMHEDPEDEDPDDDGAD